MRVKDGNYCDCGKWKRCGGSCLGSVLLTPAGFPGSLPAPRLSASVIGNARWHIGLGSGKMGQVNSQFLNVFQMKLVLLASIGYKFQFSLNSWRILRKWVFFSPSDCIFQNPCQFLKIPLVSSNTFLQTPATDWRVWEENCESCQKNGAFKI